MLNPFRLASRAAGACALALALQFPAAQAAPVVELSGATTESGFDVTVSARDVADLYAYQFTLNFDPALLTALVIGAAPLAAADKAAGNEKKRDGGRSIRVVPDGDDDDHPARRNASDPSSGEAAGSVVSRHER